jgi:uncharacterized protein involved in type VI secretion and phage assembly
MTINPKAGQDMVALIRTIVRAEIDRLHIADVGLVTESHAHEDGGDMSNYSVTVELRDSGLVLPRCPVATGRIGAVAIPNLGDLVLLQFVGGDLHRPVVVGRLYNDEDRPPVSATGELVYESLDAAEDGVRRCYLKLPNDNELEVKDDSAVLTMGATKLTIENGGQVLIEAAGDVLTKTDGNYRIEASGDVLVQAGGAIELAAGADLKAEAQANAEIKAAASAKLEAGAEATVKGAAVKIAGLTNFAAG